MPKAWLQVIIFVTSLYKISFQSWKELKPQSWTKMYNNNITIKILYTKISMALLHKDNTVKAQAWQICTWTELETEHKLEQSSMKLCLQLKGAFWGGKKHIHQIGLGWLPRLQHRKQEIQLCRGQDAFCSQTR